MKDKNVLVILDFGHGGLHPDTGKYVTKGKRSPNWTGVKNPIHNKDILYEGVCNREIGRILEEMLKGAGINYVIINGSWEDISLTDRVNTTKIFNQQFKGKCFLMSLHSNAGGGKNVEVYTSPGDTPADPMATINLEVFKEVFPEFKDSIRTDYRDGDGDKEARFTMLTDTPMPAFLPEAFFMDTKKDCELLMSEEGKYRIAQWYHQTIRRIINELF